MALLGDIYRYFRSWFANKPSRFGWIIKDKWGCKLPNNESGSTGLGSQEGKLKV
jgi:hypothetical protein